MPSRRDILQLGLAGFLPWNLIGRSQAAAPQDQASAKPDHIFLSFAGDPRTSMGLSYRVNRAEAAWTVQVLKATYGPLLKPAEAKTYPVQVMPLPDAATPSWSVKAIMKDLEPGTQYVYRVGDGTVWSEWAQFKTAAAQDEDFTLLYFGDAQNDILTHWSRVVKQANARHPEALVHLHAGDLINNANSDQQWKEWFQAGRDLFMRCGAIITPGNHEYAAKDGVRGISTFWKPQFTVPASEVKEVEGSCYTVDVHRARFIVLNSNEAPEPQAAWLDKVLASKGPKWTVVTFHHPMWSTAKGRDNKALRELWMPILEKHGVDLVLQGHDHTYGRSELTRAGAPQQASGTVYAVSVSGPKMYNINAQDWMKRKAEDTQLWQAIRFTADEMQYEAFDALGRKYDGFTMKKDNAGRKSLTNHDLTLPENLRPTA